MLALSGDEVLMCSSAELGPIDPQVSGKISAPAQSIMDGFQEIKKTVDKEGKLNGAFVPLLDKMDVATIKKCENAIKYGSKLVETWLKNFMFKNDRAATTKAKKIANYFSNHNNFLTHAKPLTLEMIKSTKDIKHLKVKDIEDVDKKLSSAVWEYYCRFEAIMKPMSPLNKIFHSENEYIVNWAPSIEIVNPIQIPKMPVPTPIPEKKPKKKKWFQI